MQNESDNIMHVKISKCQHRAVAALSGNTEATREEVNDYQMEVSTCGVQVACT